MRSDIIFGYSPITQHKASQTKDLHRGPCLGAAGSSDAFPKVPIGKHKRDAPAHGQDPCPVRATETGREALALTVQTTHPVPTILLHRARAQRGFEQSRIQQSQLTLGKPICPDCSTATDLRAGHVPRPELRDRICFAA